MLPSLYIAESISKLYTSANSFLKKNSSTFSFLVEARRIELRSILNRHQSTTSLVGVLALVFQSPSTGR